MPIYIEISRSDTDGKYVQPLSEIMQAVDGELDGIEAGVGITLMARNMSDSEYALLEEFTGW